MKIKPLNLLPLAVGVLFAASLVMACSCRENTPTDTNAPPTVLTTVPADTDTGVSISTDIIVTFSEAMDTASAGTLTAGGLPTYNESWSADSLILTVTLNSPLAYSTQYDVIIAGYKDAAGAVMTDHPFTFTTEADPCASDSTAPTLVSSSPTAGSALPAGTTSQTFTLTFSEPVMLSAADLSVDAGAAIGTVSGSGSAWTVNVTGLAGGGAYTLSVGTTLTDACGNTFAGDTVAFSVDCDTVDPTILSPMDMLIDLSLGSPLTVPLDFSEPVTGVNATTVTNAGSSGAGTYTISNITGSGANWLIEVTVVGGASGDTLDIDIANIAGINDLCGNPLGNDTLRLRFIDCATDMAVVLGSMPMSAFNGFQAPENATVWGMAFDMPMDISLPSATVGLDLIDTAGPTVVYTFMAADANWDLTNPGQPMLNLDVPAGTITDGGAYLLDLSNLLDVMCGNGVDPNSMGNLNGSTQLPINAVAPDLQGPYVTGATYAEGDIMGENTGGGPIMLVPEVQTIPGDLKRFFLSFSEMPDPATWNNITLTGATSGVIPLTITPVGPMNLECVIGGGSLPLNESETFTIDVTGVADSAANPYDITMGGTDFIGDGRVNFTVQADLMAPMIVFHDLPGQEPNAVVPGPLTFDVDFSEPVKNVAMASVDNGATLTVASGVDGDANYTIELGSLMADTLYTVDFTVVTDMAAAANPLAPPTTLTVYVTDCIPDGFPPTITNVSGCFSHLTGDGIFTVDFSEFVTGADNPSGWALNGTAGSISSVMASGMSYILDIQGIQPGDAPDIDVAVGAITDCEANPVSPAAWPLFVCGDTCATAITTADADSGPNPWVWNIGPAHDSYIYDDGELDASCDTGTGDEMAISYTTMSPANALVVTVDQTAYSMADYISFDIWDMCGGTEIACEGNNLPGSQTRTITLSPPLLPSYIILFGNGWATNPWRGYDVYLQEINCMGFTNDAVATVPVDGASNVPDSSTVMSITFDWPMDPVGGGTVTVTGSGTTGTQVFTVGVSAELTWSMGDTVLTITMPAPFDLSENVDVSWSGLVDTLCGNSNSGSFQFDTWASNPCSTPTTTTGTPSGLPLSFTDPGGCSAANAGMVSDTITISGPNTLCSVSITGLDLIINDYTNEVSITLTSPVGTSVAVMNNVGGIGTSNWTNITFADGGGPVTSGVQTGVTFGPTNPLSAFFGENPNGTWALDVFEAWPCAGAGTTEWQISNFTLSVDAA